MNYGVKWNEMTDRTDAMKDKLDLLRGILLMLDSLLLFFGLFDDAFHMHRLYYVDEMTTVSRGMCKEGAVACSDYGKTSKPQSIQPIYKSRLELELLVYGAEVLGLETWNVSWLIPFGSSSHGNSQASE